MEKPNKLLASIHITDVTWEPILTTHAVDNPLPKTAASASCQKEKIKSTQQKMLKKTQTYSIIINLGRARNQQQQKT